ncbi:P-loop containing nucleoside triphosphate hydrolase protein [Xylariaceae sp. FL0255]|nr:P-loop containing nucleoside triphosphate hydrolase protein [Xylariaceae sp. FL0255]
MVNSTIGFRFQHEQPYSTRFHVMRQFHSNVGSPTSPSISNVADSKAWNILDGKYQDTRSQQQSTIFEYVEVVFVHGLKGTGSRAVGHLTSNEKAELRFQARGHDYIKILSLPVIEALRCVVDYFPGIRLSDSVLKIYEPYEIFIFYENELNEYRKRLEVGFEGEEQSVECANRHAIEHIAVVQKFVRDRMQLKVDAERQRHARGYATFDMLWLLYKPGTDVYFDQFYVKEYQPHVVHSVSFALQDGSAPKCVINLWNIKTDLDYIGPSTVQESIPRFGGERPISTLRVVPCDSVRFMEGVNESNVESFEDQFRDQGKKWYGILRNKGWYWFDGHGHQFPRQTFSSYVMVDRIQYEILFDDVGPDLLYQAPHSSHSQRLCDCSKCKELIYDFAVDQKFIDYFGIQLGFVEQLTDHQYFLCDTRVPSFLFKHRDWRDLHISGFREPFFDKTLFERLVLRDETKNLIRTLTHTYLNNNAEGNQTDEKLYQTMSTMAQNNSSRDRNSEATWSADFIRGKGEGLSFLLHGKPGVGKTYTAECIANLSERPLLTLTCTDIGVDPVTIEGNLNKWFNLAHRWGVIMLIDEADIYLEERKSSDLRRNNLVASFLRALEYFKGILFLTTNLWDQFFQKLEEDRETTMRIPQPTKDYVQSRELLDLKWNGREIRNAFQIAVALAESQGQKDAKGRILVKPEHIRATVGMSRDFKNYLTSLYKGDPSKRAAAMGTRLDNYKPPEQAEEEAGPSRRRDIY